MCCHAKVCVVLTLPLELRGREGHVEEGCGALCEGGKVDLVELEATDVITPSVGAGEEGLDRARHGGGSAVGAGCC